MKGITILFGKFATEAKVKLSMGQGGYDYFIGSVRYPFSTRDGMGLDVG
jgi:hypothetical protein